jgi:D-glycero-alpha-D-manno-heptose-7-phosphate kinase
VTADGWARTGGIVMTRTPLRISFAGGGTDLSSFYESDHGAVLSTTIDKYVYVTVKRHGRVFDERIRVNYSVSESVSEIDAVRNDIARECMRLLEVEPPIYISVVSDLPDSSGLGGSSAFAVGLLNALHTLHGERISAGQLAEEASHVEMVMLQAPIGRQDQYAAAFGGLNVFRFLPGDRVSVEPVRISTASREALFSSLLMVWTGHQRRANTVLAEQQTSLSLHRDDMSQMREQAFQLQAMLGADPVNLHEVGQLLDSSWRLKRGLASSISTPQIDAWYAGAMEAGAAGGKLCGAGGGGFLMFVVDGSRREAVGQALDGLTVVPVAHESRGSQVLLPRFD